MGAMGKDLVALASRHLRVMLEKAPGPKLLLLDSETTGILACAVSQSEILQKEVFLVARLDALPSGSFEHLSAVCFLRPTSENILLLLRLLQQQQRQPRRLSDGQQDLEQPLEALEPHSRIKELHLFFSGALQRQFEMLKRLARQDEIDKIAQRGEPGGRGKEIERERLHTVHDKSFIVYEVFVDMYPLGPRLFSLSVPAVSQLQMQNLSLWTAYDEMLFQRMVDGLFSCIALLGGGAVIRFLRGSAVCQRLAAAVQNRVAEARTFALQAQAQDAVATAEATGRLVLLLFDRREDPAMVHELLGIRHNRVDLHKVSGIVEDLKEVVLSTTQDEFYKATKTHAQITSLEAMRNFIEQYPECRKMSGSVFKHVTIIHELSRLVQERQLLRVSEFEQDLSTREARGEHLKTILEFLRDDTITNMDKLRLALLYAIRYENDPSVASLKGELRRAGLEAEEVQLLEAITQYSNAAIRSGDLLQNKSFLAVAKNSITKGLQVSSPGPSCDASASETAETDRGVGVTNVFTQHKSLMYSVVDCLIKGRLKETTYPVLQSHPSPYGAASAGTPLKEKLQTVVVFVVGGATYEEERDMEELSRASGVSVMLGGTTMLNSRTFLADVSQLIKGHTLSTAIPVSASWRP
ncbi:sec1 family protein [Cyclospora cayetanensis]|uniref:Sec1 family protein n=1 Tax=Cyclospora cayetanensis TaxID=88456 RepID=A0A1D3D0G7_9EIME|nr:sec1 family protein [Cyclospora cayetanensis]